MSYAESFVFHRDPGEAHEPQDLLDPDNKFHKADFELYHDPYDSSSYKTGYRRGVLNKEISVVRRASARGLGEAEHHRRKSLLEHADLPPNQKNNLVI